LRNALMIRMRAEATLGSLGLDVEVERQLQMHRARLAVFQDIEKRHYAELNPSRSTAIAHQILRKGIMLESMWIDWSVQALGVLRKEYPPA